MKKPIITWKSSDFDLETMKTATHTITSIAIDNFNSMVGVTIERGMQVEHINLTMEQAQEIGFINLKTLKDYCKF